MADLEKEVTYRAGVFDARAETDLRRIADVEPRDLQIYADAVKVGRFQLWEVMEGGERVGTVIWSALREPDGFSLVVNAAAVSTATKTDMTAHLFETFRAMAEKIGAHSFLIWTERAGLARKMERLGATRKFVMEVKTK